MSSIANILELTKWMSQQERKNILNDFWVLNRQYNNRQKLFSYVIEQFKLTNEPINYLEFGVCQGESFKWWIEHTTNNESRYFGFDTFEGLPEDWGLYKKGDMDSKIPQISDSRAKFIRGLFQESLPVFLTETDLSNKKRKVIHLDADLFSSTIYALTMLAPYLNKGDILLFDEFNVPNHEFKAFKIFIDSFYIETKLVGAVNNYYQVAIEITNIPGK